MDLSEGKLTIQSMDAHIREMDERLKILKSSRSQLAVAMCEYVLNRAASCDRDCCGPRPRQLMFGVLDCDKSPIGTCVYSQRSDPEHKNCLFCNLSEDRD